MLIPIDCDPRPWPKKTIAARDKRGRPLPYPRLVPQLKGAAKEKWYRWANAVQTKTQLYMRKYGVEPISGPIAFGVICIVPRPKSVSVKKRPFPIVKPDFDNFKYAIMNLLKGILFEDDCQQVVDLPGVEVYSDPEVLTQNYFPPINREQELYDAEPNVRLANYLPSGRGMILNISKVSMTPGGAVSWCRHTWEFFERMKKYQ